MLEFKVKNLCIQQDNTIILENINLTIKEGLTVSISGEIGSGKTSLLYVLGLLAKPSAGHIYIGSSVDCVSLPRTELDEFINRYFAYVFHEPKLMIQWSAVDNISLPLIAKGYTKAEAQEKAQEYCKLVGIEIEKATKKTVSTLSIGTRKLVTVARALAKEPKILIADEPVANLDEETRKKTANLLIEQAKQKNMIIIAATHLKEAKELFKEQYIIKDKHLRNVHESRQLNLPEF